MSPVPKCQRTAKVIAPGDGQGDPRATKVRQVVRVSTCSLPLRVATPNVFTFKPLTAAARVEVVAKTRSAEKADLSGQDQFGRPGRDHFGRPVTQPPGREKNVTEHDLGNEAITSLPLPNPRQIADFLPLPHGTGGAGGAG